MRAAVIHGGISTEYDVSVASGQGVIAALARRGHEVTAILVDRDGQWHGDGWSGQAAAARVLLECDVAVPALHGVQGEDGTIQGFLEILGVPYVGSGVRASAVCLDKLLTKLVVARAGVPVARGIAIDRDRAALASTRPRELTDLVLELAHHGIHLPIFVKPVHGGSSIGVSRVADRADLAAALVAAGDDSVLIEAEILGLEVDVPVLELPTGELRCGPSLLINSDPAEPFFNEAAKYRSTGTHFTIPAPTSPWLTTQLERLAVEAFRALGCRGLARVDFFVSPKGPVLNEVNTFPGFTAHSQFPQMWAAAGLSYDDLVDVLVRAALPTRTTRLSANDAVCR